MPENEERLRYEYRVFVQDSALFEKTIEKNYEKLEHNKRRSLYVLLQECFAYNIKFRDNRLSIKKLLETKEGFQKWTPLEEKEAKELLQSLLKEKKIDADATDQNSIVDALQNSSKGCALNVHKDRIRYKKENMLCEITSVEVKEQTYRSICLESQELQPLKQELFNLGLNAYKNQSYRDKLITLC